MPLLFDFPSHAHALRLPTPCPPLPSPLFLFLERVAVACTSSHSTVQVMKPCQVSTKNANELFTGASFNRYFRNSKNLQWGRSVKGLIKSMSTMLDELRSNKRLKGLQLKTTVLLAAEAASWKSLGRSRPLGPPMQGRASASASCSFYCFFYCRYGIMVETVVERPAVPLYCALYSTQMPFEWSSAIRHSGLFITDKLLAIHKCWSWSDRPVTPV